MAEKESENTVKAGKNITIKKRSHTYENDLDDIMRIKTNVYGKTSRVYLYAYPTSRTAAR